MTDFQTYDRLAEQKYRAERIRNEIVGARRRRLMRRRPPRLGPADPSTWQ